MNWQRATTLEKKSERKKVICDATINLFKTKGYENVTFNAIAREAGFTKSNMYRYFSSREDIFLSIFTELFQDWSDDCTRKLHALKQDTEASKFAKTYVKILKSHPHFLELAPILFISLERNSSFDQLYSFKQLASGLLFQITNEITRIYPEINGELSFKLLDLCHGATCSSWTKASTNEVLDKLYKMKEFKQLKPNFEKELESAIEIFILGVKAKSKLNQQL